MNPSHDYRKREIAVRDLLYLTLKKWRLLLLLALAFALLWTLWGILKEGKAAGGPDAAAAYSAERAAYDEEAEGLKTVIEESEERLSERIRYLSRSALMDIDPACTGKASVTILFLPEGAASAAQLADAYAARVTYGTDWTKIAKELSLDPAYAAELVRTLPSVAVSDQFSGGNAAYAGTPGRDTLTVTAVYSDAGTAARILDEVLRQLKEAEAEIAARAGAHRVVYGEVLTSEGIDTVLDSRSSALLEDIYVLTTNKERLEEKLGQLKKPAAPAAGAGALSAGFLVRRLLTGFLGGAVLAFLLILSCLTLSGRVLSGYELSRIYGLPVLSLIPDQPLRTSLPDRLAEAIGSEAKNAAPAALRYQEAAAALLAALGKETAPALREGGEAAPARVLLLGALPSKRLEECALHLGEALAAEEGGTPAPDILCADPPGESPASLKALREADAIVLAAQIGVSSYVSTTRILNTAEACRTKVLGAIIL